MFASIETIWQIGIPFAQTAGFWLSDSAANHPAMDRVFQLILIISSLLFLLVAGLLVYFVVRYRCRSLAAGLFP